MSWTRLSKLVVINVNNYIILYVININCCERSETIQNETEKNIEQIM